MSGRELREEEAANELPAEVSAEKPLLRPQTDLLLPGI